VLPDDTSDHSPGRSEKRISTTPVAHQPGLHEPTAVLKAVQRAGSGNLAPVIMVMSGQHIGLMFTVSQAATVIGRDGSADVQLQDGGVSRQHCKVSARGLEVTLEDLGSTNGTFVNRNQVTRCVLANGDQIELGRQTTLKFAYQDEQEQAFQQGLYNASVRDHLTGSFNKRYFMDRLRAEHASALRHKLPLSLLLFDLDHFKSVNDTFGHGVGDLVLKRLASVVAQAVRADDIFARFGGEEFVVISRNLTQSNAHAFAERLREIIERTEIEGVPGLRVTISIGFATLTPGGPSLSIEALLEAADRQLYVAKRAGRNRVKPDLQA
jgi:diguanylate cyclase (GGDEF)-like protein